MASNGNGTGSKPGFVFGVSNTGIAIVGTIALAVVGAHLLGTWLRPSHAITVSEKTGAPTMVEAMFAEALATASHPETVMRNADRVHAAIQQRAPRLRTLIEKAHNGEHGPHKVAEGIHHNVSDILEQLEIPQNPHPTGASPQLVDLFRDQRLNDMSSRFGVPGGLILDPFERRWLEHEQMSYQATTDPVLRQRLREMERDQREAGRLERLRAREAARQAHIHQRELQESLERHGRASSMFGQRTDYGSGINENRLSVS